MTSRPAWLLAPVLAAAAFLAAGCGSTTVQPAPSVPAVPSVPPSLATSLVTAGGSWAAVVMGGPASQDNAFWQLFARPGASTAWKVATPPGVATNGGLVLAGLGGRSLLTGFRPGVDLTFSALITTGDNGASWSPGSVLDPGLADVPDALAAAPGSGRLTALLAGGKVDQSADSGTTWTALTTQRSLAGSPAGRQCGLTTLTAASYAPSGAPLLAGTCGRPGTAGVFSYSGGAVDDGRTRAARGTGRPARRGAPADEPGGRGDGGGQGNGGQYGSPGRRHRDSREPARRLVRRRRRALVRVRAGPHRPGRRAGLGLRAPPGPPG